jgi:hypothetical protein
VGEAGGDRVTDGRATDGLVTGGRVRGDRAGERAGGQTAEPPADAISGAPRRRHSRGGVSVVAGGLLQDLEDRLRRDLAPIEERVRPGGEIRGVAGGESGPAGPGDPLVIILPAAPVTGPDQD